MITSLLIVAVYEISKRSSFIGALLASLPLISVLAMIWLYIDAKDIKKVTGLANSVFWLVIPSFVFYHPALAIKEGDRLLFKHGPINAGNNSGMLFFVD